MPKSNSDSERELLDLCSLVDMVYTLRKRYVHAENAGGMIMVCTLLIGYGMSYPGIPWHDSVYNTSSVFIVQCGKATFYIGKSLVILERLICELYALLIC